MKRTDLILLLLNRYGETDEPTLVGTTRLQKLIFLAEKEGAVAPDQDEGFGFEAYKFGPVSKKLYDDLTFLVNLGLMAKSNEPTAVPSEPGDLDSLSADDLLSPDEAEEETEETGDEATPSFAGDDSVVYRLTDRGISYLKDNSLDTSATARQIEKVKRRYSRYALTDLLRYVYTKYPDYATESEIRDRLL